MPRIFNVRVCTQDETLRQAVAALNGKNWKLVANYLQGKTEVQCLHRWTKVLNPSLTKGPWTAQVPIVLTAVVLSGGLSAQRYLRWLRNSSECPHPTAVVLLNVLQEDQTVIELVGRIGAKKWSQIAQQLPGRIGKQCRERWHNHLNPNINKAPWSEQEDRYGP
jgi:hypothetical protein